MIDKKKDEVKTEGKMPLVNVVIVLIGVVVFSWLVFVLVVVHFQVRDPGEPVQGDENVPPGYSLANSTYGDSGHPYNDDS